jgi:hypothetical protein
MRERIGEDPYPNKLTIIRKYISNDWVIQLVGIGFFPSLSPFFLKYSARERKRDE